MNTLEFVGEMSTSAALLGYWFWCRDLERRLSMLEGRRR